MKKILLALMLALPLCSSARWSALSNYEIGFSYAYAIADYKGANPYYGSGGEYLRDTTIKKTVTSSFGYGAFVGTYFPFTRLGEHASVGLSVSIVEAAYIWGNLLSGYNVDGEEDLTGSFGGLTTQVGVPLGIDLKTGCNAVGVKNQRFTTSIGAGVIPSLTFTVAENGLADFGGGLSFSAAPYAKAEVGVFAGICFKLRAMVAFGSIPLIDENKSLLAGSDSGHLKMTGKTMAQLSFVIMPFSWAWKKEGWWNRSLK